MRNITIALPGSLRRYTLPHSTFCKLTYLTHASDLTRHLILEPNVIKAIYPEILKHNTRLTAVTLVASKTILDSILNILKSSTSHRATQFQLNLYYETLEDS